MNITQALMMARWLQIVVKKSEATNQIKDQNKPKRKRKVYVL